MISFITLSSLGSDKGSISIKYEFLYYIAELSLSNLYTIFTFGVLGFWGFGVLEAPV